MFGHYLPGKHQSVQLFMRRMKREYGLHSRQAEGLTRDIREQLAAVTDQSLKGYRDVRF